MIVLSYFVFFSQRFSLVPLEHMLGRRVRQLDPRALKFNLYYSLSYLVKTTEFIRCDSFITHRTSLMYVFSALVCANTLSALTHLTDYTSLLSK